MIIQIGTDVDESRILWKYKESDEWKRADIDDLIRAYEKFSTPISDTVGDTISRADALMEARPEYLNPNQEKLASYNQGWNNAIEMYYRQIAELSSVESEQRKLFHDAYEQGRFDAKEESTGEWIKATGMMPPEFHGHHCCSKCGNFANMQPPFGNREDLSKFCPSCGVKMRNGYGGNNE